MASLACTLALTACSDAEDPSVANPAMGAAGTVAPGTAGAPAAGSPAPGGAVAGTGGVAGGAAGMVAIPTAGTGGAGAGGAGAGGAGASGTGGSAGMEPPPAGSAGGTPDMPDAGGPMPDAMVVNEDLGEGDGSDVITIGDSWMSLGLEGIQQSLVAVSGQPYRTYGVGGTRMLTGAIPGQYDSAKQADPDIKTVVMTGGGNDILLTGLSNACATGTMACRTQLEAVTASLTELWTEMAADGVRDVVLIHYASDAGSGVAESLMHDQRLMTACAAVPAPLRCHLMFTDEFVMGQYRDTVHPTGPAYDRIAEGVYALMIAEGMRR